MFSLMLYRDGESDNRRPGAARPTGPHQQMKTTTLFRNIANPRRTTLAHLTDAEQLQRPEQPEHAATLLGRDGQPAPHHPDGSARPGAGHRREVTRGDRAAAPRRPR